MTAILFSPPLLLLPEIAKFDRSFLLRPPSTPKKSDPHTSPSGQDQSAEAPMEAVVCRQCLHEITSVDQIRQIRGAHIHTFANPEGIVFEIGCYRDAWGCGYVGPASAEFTWFSGYVWRIAICANCLAHLGWRFAAPDGRFFHGLITSRIHAHSVDRKK